MEVRMWKVRMSQNLRVGVVSGVEGENLAGCNESDFPDGRSCGLGGHGTGL